MGEGYSVIRGEPREYYEGNAPGLDEQQVRANLAALGFQGAEGAEEGIVEAGTGSVFWQVALLRDAQGTLKMLDGEVYEDAPLVADDVRLMNEMIRDLAAALGARAWTDTGTDPTELTPAEIEALVTEAQQRAGRP